MSHLNLCFPEWQGYAESNSVYHGAIALREQLATKHPFIDISVPTNESLPILHDIKGYDANLRQLRQTSAAISVHQPTSMFLVGGTCASEIAPVSWINKQYDGDLCVLWFDAHGDLNTPKTSSSKHFHGMPLRNLLGEGDPAMLHECHSFLRPEQVLLVGTRELDPEEERLYNSMNYK